MRKNHLLLLLTFFSTTTALAQFTLSGKITDRITQQSLPGATIQIGGSLRGTASAIDGSYRLNKLPPGKYKLEVRYLGYALKEVELSLAADQTLDIALEPAARITEEIVVRANRAGNQSPIAHTNLDKAALEDQNHGQDLPYLLQLTPSVVVTSDAGAGVGYTGIRVRGSDPTRINVTINGIPVNDAESHGVFWVNMPDFASSVSSVQLQRGVGTSTNGSGAFGASLNLQTNEQSDTAYTRVGLGFGSFNTQRQQINFGTGVLKNGWNFNGRLSRIVSDGYIDRASSNLRSYGFSASKTGKKSVTRFNLFSGVQQTYQAWNGIISDSLATNRRYNPSGRFTAPDGSTRFYDNETDNYQQDHYQFFHNYDLNDRWKINTTLFYTRGKGYFEQYRESDELANYGINPPIVGGDTINESDLIRRRWLDNHFYGGLLNATYTLGGLEAVVGGGWYRYDGDHFGEVIWSRFAGNSQIRDRYYDNNAVKTDYNLFAKAEYSVGKKIQLFADLQVRGVDYRFLGFDNDGNNVTQEANFLFVNPKAGLNYRINTRQLAYFSVAVGNREPVRDDFTESTPTSRPNAERLIDYEAGWRWQGNRQLVQVNAFYMDYKNQLVLTGQINDVGAYIRRNVAESYRLGIEVEYALEITKNLRWNANLTLSENRIGEYNEFVDSYDADFNYLDNVLLQSRSNTPIAFSPGVIAASMLSYSPIAGLELAWQAKYVGEQFVDNSGEASRKLGAYQLNDLRIEYRRPIKAWFEEVRLALLVNNVLDLKYVSNGYVYPYLFNGSLVNELYVYPQAGRNFMVNLYFGF